MKINHIGGPHGNSSLPAAARTRFNIKNKLPKKNGPSGDSAAAKDLQKLSAMEKERAAKVEKIKSQVESGTYKIDPKQIAEKMVAYYKV